MRNHPTLPTAHMRITRIYARTYDDGEYRIQYTYVHTYCGTGTETNVPWTSSLPCSPRYGNSTRRWFAEHPLVHYRSGGGSTGHPCGKCDHHFYPILFDKRDWHEDTSVFSSSGGGYRTPVRSLQARFFVFSFTRYSPNITLLVLRIIML